MIEISLDCTAPSQFATGCLVLPVWQGGELQGAAADMDATLGGLISEILQEDGFKAALGETRTLYGVQGLSTRHVILLGLGKEADISPLRLRRAASRGARAVRSIRKSHFGLVVPITRDLPSALVAEALTDGISLGLHLYNDLKTGADKPINVESATLLLPAEQAELAQVVETSLVRANANLRARALVNRPSNLKSPEFLAQNAREIAAEAGLAVEVWDEYRILEERFGALHGVGVGSENPPRFIVLEYAPPGTEKTRPIALVGKGMTFDSGGYSLKPSTSMEDMKDDMAGAAVVLAAMSALPSLGINKRVLGIIPSAENMISGRAQRPGDVVTARNGKTIEVLNTDAEGRLILADALSWTCEQDPELIVDFATLTGAIGIALGQEAAGLFSNDEELASRLLESGQATGERLWQFPMWEEYKEYVKGTSSDLRNIASPDRRAGAIVGAVFLDYFVDSQIPWAHLDIAAVSLVRDDRLLTARGATGFGVRLILDFLSKLSR